MLARRVFVDSDNYIELTTQGWTPGRTTHYVNIDWPPLEEIIMTQSEEQMRMKYTRVVATNPEKGAAPLSMFVFLEQLDMSEVLDILCTELPTVVIPYWYPNSLVDTKRAAHNMVVNTVPNVLVGVVAPSPYDIFDLVAGEFSPVVLGPGALGDHPDKALYQLEARGLFAPGDWIHVSHGVGTRATTYPPSRVTYSDDFTYLRSEAE